MIIGNTRTFALEHRLLEFLSADEGKREDFYGSLAVWVNGKRFTTYDWETWLTYVHGALWCFPREHPDLFPDPGFVYAENYGIKPAKDFCGLIDFYVFGIGRNYSPTNEEIRIGGRIIKHEVGGIFDAPFCDWFPIYLIDLPNGIRRIILRDRRQSDTLHECRLPRTEMENTLREWCAAFEKDAREFREIWGPFHPRWLRMTAIVANYQYHVRKVSDEMIEKILWDFQEKFAQKHGLKVPSRQI